MKREIIVSGYAYPSVSRQVLESWLPDLTYIDTFSYGITPQGGLIDLNDEEIINIARESGVTPLMVITPMDKNGVFNDAIASQLLEAPSSRETLIENILENINEKNLGGADFDFEYIPAKNKEQYVQLINDARISLNREGYTVTVSLAPKTSTEQRGSLYEGHDYRGLGEAANLVLLMTYEWGYTFGPPLPVSPINEVRKVIEYGLSEIPESKILMGVPNYGYDWTLPFIQGESRAEKISNEEGAARALRYGANIEYNQTAQAPGYRYFDERGKEHQVWFEDERSIRAQLALIEEYNLAGAGYWNIMEYNPINSEVLNAMYSILKL